MKKLIFYALCIFSSYNIFAQSVIKTIPDSIFNNSNTVIRRYATDIRVFNSNKIEVAEYIVVSFLGIEELRKFRINSIISSSLDVKDLKSKVYDKNGKRMKKLNAIINRDNNYLKILLTDKIVAASFPVSIEIEYKSVLSDLTESKKWRPVAENDTKVQYASLRLSVIDSSFVDFNNNLIPSPIINLDDNGVYIYIWELNNYTSTKKGSSKELPPNDFPYVNLKWKD